ncbi:MAG: hypothetical protein ROZ36_19705 [Thermincola sp.]|nr:hypothetical protein [Thermincola sp.]
MQYTIKHNSTIIRLIPCHNNIKILEFELVGYYLLLAIEGNVYRVSKIEEY